LIRLVNTSAHMQIELTNITDLSLNTISSTTRFDTSATMKNANQYKNAKPWSSAFLRHTMHSNAFAISTLSLAFTARKIL
jgi:hypothetical protein